MPVSTLWSVSVCLRFGQKLRQTCCILRLVISHPDHTQCEQVAQNHLQPHGLLNKKGDNQASPGRRVPGSSQLEWLLTSARPLVAIAKNDKQPSASPMRVHDVVLVSVAASLPLTLSQLARARTRPHR